MHHTKNSKLLIISLTCYDAPHAELYTVKTQYEEKPLFVVPLSETSLQIDCLNTSRSIVVRCFFASVLVVRIEKHSNLWETVKIGLFKFLLDINRQMNGNKRQSATDMGFIKFLFRARINY